MAHYQFTLPSGQLMSFDIPSPLTSADRMTSERVYGLVLQSIPDAPEPTQPPRQSPAEHAVEQQWLDPKYGQDSESYRRWDAQRRRRR